MIPDVSCDYCGEPACTVTRWGGDQACFLCANELDALYADTLRGRLEDFHSEIAALSSPLHRWRLGRKMAGLEAKLLRHTRQAWNRSAR